MRKPTRLALLLAVAFAGVLHVIADAQGQVGQNINIVSGSDDQFIGDMFRQRQNEGVVGISSVNPSHMMAAYNDYRTVDFAFDQGVGTPSPAQSFVAKLWNFLRAPWRRERERELEGGEGEEADAAQAWIGLSFTDNGVDWYTGLLPGHPGDTSQPPPLFGFEAASDPVLATTHNQFFLGGIAFTPSGQSAGFVSRFTDRNDTSTGQNIQFDWTRTLLTQEARFFVDKPSIAAGPNGHVYAAFVVFDQQDPKKLSSKIVFFRSADYGETWSSGTVISQPLTRNQAPWILVDPNNENIVYVGWRLFAYPALPNLTNAIVGRKSTNGGQSFSPSVPFPVALLLKAFDAPQVSLSTTSPQIPRSNAYPTATIDGSGGIHVAIQEYVYPSNHPTAALRGLPLAPSASTLTGVPRITVTSSYDGGTFWTPRRAIDLGTATTPAGTQFMPVLTAVGEPGPSCPGRTGPSSRVMAMYYDARAGLVGRVSGSNGGVAGGDKQFDVRIAQASACNRDILGRLNFSPSEQLSRYSLSSTPPHGIVTTAGVSSAGHAVTSVNRAYSMFCGGNCAFTGDYIHLTPRVPYVQTAVGWRPTTANSVDKNALPAPLVQGAWADMRDAVLPTFGALRPVPASAPQATPPYSSDIDSLPWDAYQAPGSGMLPDACHNAGARDQNIYTAMYAPGQLFAAAPDTFRPSNIPHAYPLYVENRSGQQRFFRLTINAAAFASFDYRSFVTPGPAPIDRNADIAIGPYSTVTGSVVVGAGQAQPIVVTVRQLASTIVGGNIVSNGTLLAGGAQTTVTLYPTPVATASVNETHTPVVAPTPTVTRPLADQLSPTNPFQVTAQTPFSQTPFSQTTTEQSPFSQTPFSQTPFSQTGAIYDVIDFSFDVTVAGSDAAAFSALLAVRNALEMKGSYLFQVLINRISSRMALDGCKAFDRAQETQISNIVTPFSQTPFSQTPFSQTPFSQTPFSQTPFSQTPFSQTPFSQTPFSQTAGVTEPRDPAITNSSFYIAPSGGSSPTYRAARRVDKVVYVLRAYQIAPIVPPNASLFDANGNAQVGITVVANTPEVKNGVFDPAGPPKSSGGAAVPVNLTFVTQPRSTVPGASMTPPIQVALVDAFNNIVTGSSPAVTLTIGNNPGESTLGGVTTRSVRGLNGIATFADLTINNAGAGYTLVASSGTLGQAISEPFDILPLTVPLATLFDGVQGNPYPPTPQALQATGGTPPYTWSLDPNAQVVHEAGPNTPAILPPGLTLNPATGVISGIAATAGEFSFRAVVTDALGRKAAENFCIHIDPNLGANLITTSIQEGATAQSLAESLINPTEAGVTIPAGSALFHGSSNSVGRFTGGGGATQGVGFDRGVILSSGLIAGATGPNDRTNMSILPLGLVGDADLAGLAGTVESSTFDAAILEFDFTPTCNLEASTCNVTFEYVFGSDEYNEYANRDFNDVFGFFLRDVTPGFEGPHKNYAVLPLPAPNDNIAVAINNVNGGSNPANGGYPFTDPDPAFPSAAVNPQFFRNNRTATALPDPTDGPSGTLNVQADGLTVPLQFNAPVVSGHTYHIKLGITDVTDGLFDSWVFIKSGTFKVTHICPIVVVGPTIP
jgi:hypothetical protein